MTQEKSPKKTYREARTGSVSLTLLACLVGSWVVTGCMEPEVPKATRDPRTQKWLDRAKASFRVVDMDDASDAAEEALRASPNDPEVRMVAAHVALAQLDYSKALQLTEGIATSESYALRGRAHWYAGNVEEAGKELGLLLRDPEVHDDWAKAVVQLAARGAGRKPFTSTGGILATTEMPRIRGTAMAIPVEIDGEQGLALIATGTAEVVLDSSQRKEPSWVSIGIGGRIEYQDVPALTRDLSGVAKQLGIPSIKAMLGVNFLRHVNGTFDFMAQQFVARRFEPPRPPNATDVPLSYVRGGGMVFRTSLKPDGQAPAAVMVDTAMAFPIALDTPGWKKAGVDLTSLRPIPNEPKLKEGVVSMLRMGAYDLPQVAGVAGVEFGGVESVLGIDLDGVVGSGLVGGFRVTFGNGGRTMWLEDEAASGAVPVGGAPEEPQGPPGSSSPPVPGSAPPPPASQPPPGGIPGSGPIDPSARPPVPPGRAPK